MPRYDLNGVPILDVSQKTVDVMGEPRPHLKGAALDDDPLITGVTVVVHNPDPVGASGPTTTVFRIGGETLNEAAKTVAGTIVVHARQVPDWVASDHEQLAEILAEHWSSRGHKVEARGLSS